MQFLARVVLFLLLLLSVTASAYSQTQAKQQLAEAAATYSNNSRFMISDSRTCAE
jgi:hypothetical protein